MTQTQVEGKDYQTPAQIPGLDKFADSTYDTGSGGSTYNTSRGGPQQSSTGTAPTATQPGTGLSGDHLKPKGKNLHEVDTFDNEEQAPNASFKYGQDVGSKYDPGYAAEQGFEHLNAKVADDSGYSGGKQGFQGGQGGFERLGSDERA